MFSLLHLYLQACVINGAGVCVRFILTQLCFFVGFFTTHVTAGSSSSTLFTTYLYYISLLHNFTTGSSSSTLSLLLCPYYSVFTTLSLLLLCLYYRELIQHSRFNRMLLRAFNCSPESARAAEYQAKNTLINNNFGKKNLQKIFSSQKIFFITEMVSAPPSTPVIKKKIQNQQLELCLTWYSVYMCGFFSIIMYDDVTYVYVMYDDVTYVYYV